MLLPAPCSSLIWASFDVNATPARVRQPRWQQGADCLQTYFAKSVCVWNSVENMQMGMHIFPSARGQCSVLWNSGLTPLSTEELSTGPLMCVIHACHVVTPCAELLHVCCHSTLMPGITLLKKQKTKNAIGDTFDLQMREKKRKKKSNHTFANTHTCTDTGALVPPRGWFATELMCCTSWLLSFYKTLQGENKPVCTKDMLFTDVVPFINGSLWKDLYLQLECFYYNSTECCLN